MDNNFTENLKKAGYKITKPRLVLLGLLCKAKHPMSVKEIVKSIGSKKINQVTVYRILTAFKKAGIIAQVDFQAGCAYFEVRDNGDHHHIICTECKKVEDFVGCDYDALSNEALKQSNDFKKVMHHSFELFGICNTCILKQS
ncbi:MAG: hypothetical protein A3A98_02685 [Candidatus Staskawiczbacteria bacterium RIFCSPLOWO2_01_FULL_40_39]|uniref:Transcriptional repressor n=1 Tax=Candidatus Staskawiczbacteria bacterium RIFCSPHIGHO2_01_FULL_39_25 TaxID=1802202 RepID=A0A1G2HP84_9BACT|nr:MAG: hypothetical protein A2730_02410 [Candidatus Staskawiczbacteria bacterium RIFCSPHIGHO2_01_FULL_39_25]OGZ73654.1 MAG: hypothetical protein A3A98_02685 [Candidatus Staskawiczbacteria bacterium RIFCSPLOWO2_01_FULL_40_39]